MNGFKVASEDSQGESGQNGDQLFSYTFDLAHTKDEYILFISLSPIGVIDLLCI